MLSDEQIQLLTTYVDGQLTHEQQRSVACLLQQSPQARALLAQFQEDAQQIRRLPRHKLEPSAVPVVLQTIAERELRIARPVRSRRRWARYAIPALAASIVLAVLGGLWFIADKEQQTTIAASNETPARPAVVERVTPERPAPLRRPNTLVHDVVDGVVASFAAPIPVERPQPPFSIGFRELQKDLAADRLVAQLEKQRSVQLDVTVKNNATALERLRGVLQENGIKVVVDPQAQKGKQAEYLVYAENLRTDELTRILREVGRDDTQLQKFQKSTFEKVTLTPLTEKEKNQVSTLIGVEPAKLETRPTTETSEPSFNRWERSALVLSASASGRPSAEVQSFAGQRRPQPGTLQVLVRIHQDK